MTEQSSVAPGWYPDGNGATRWWDGSAWTEHVAPAQAPAAQPAVAQQQAEAAAQAQYAQQAYAPYGGNPQQPAAASYSSVAQPAAGPLQRPQIAPDAPVDSFWTWIVAVLPFITVPALFLFDFRGYFQASFQGDLYPMSGFMIGILALDLVSLAVTAFVIVSAWRDYRTLLAQGVVRPFHWAFAFLGSIVYLIGRHVVLRKVCRTPGWPLWVHLALQVVMLIVMFIWMAWFMQMMFGEIDMLMENAYMS